MFETVYGEWDSRASRTYVFWNGMFSSKKSNLWVMARWQDGNQRKKWYANQLFHGHSSLYISSCFLSFYETMHCNFSTVWQEN